MSDPSLTVIIAVAHPKHAAIHNYETVERVLETVVRSHLGQKLGEINVVVVCHRIPSFANGLDHRVHFIDVSDASEFEVGRNPVGIDKGMKYLIGALFSHTKFQPDFLMLADADDFVRKDLIKTLNVEPQQNNDGFVLKRGYHALLSAQPDRIQLKGVFQVKAFDVGCGTCRIFRTQALLSKLQSFNGEVFDENAFENGNTPQSKKPKTELCVRADLLALRKPFATNIIHGIGRHTGQAAYFDLAEINRPLAAKGCGHNNHVGPKKGDVHWRRITKLESRTTFARKFSLAGDVEITSVPSVLAHTRAAWRLFQRRLMRLRNFLKKLG